MPKNNIVMLGILTVGLAVSGCKSSEAKPAIPGTVTGTPLLVDLGSKVCIPCKLMAPILEELSKEYDGRLRVVFLDVREDPAAGKPYAIEKIPTQVFYDPAGKELFRHEGFFSKQQILAKWKELGFDLSAKPASQPAQPSESCGGT